MVEFKYHVTYSTQVFLPIILSGVLGLGTVFSLYLYKRFKERVYLSISFFLFCSSLFALFETLVNHFGVRQLRGMAAEFTRLEQVTGALFLVAVPWFLYNISRDTYPKATRFFIKLGTVSVLIMVSVAFIYPDLFVSLTKFRYFSLTKEGAYGRGEVGLFYNIRDVLLFVVFIFAFIFMTRIMKSRRFQRFTKWPYIGLILGILFAISDILNLYTQHYAKYLPDLLDFSYTVLGLCLFGLLTMFGVFHQLLARLKERDVSIGKIQKMALIGGLEYFPEDGMLHLSNEFRDTFGISGEGADISIKGFSESYVYNPDRTIFEEVTGTISGTRSMDAFSCRIKTGEKIPKWAHFSSPVILSQAKKGKINHLIWSVQDITEQKRIEEELNRSKEELEQHVQQRTAQLREQTKVAQDLAEKAQIANQAKNVFLAKMSHEFRTPLNGVLGMNSLLRETGLNKEQLEFTAYIQKSAEFLLSTLSNILDIIDMEKGKFRLLEQDFDIHRLMEEFSAEMKTKAVEKGLTLNHAVAGDVPRCLRGDPDRILQILSNLVENSIKFTKKGGIDIYTGLDRLEGAIIWISFEVKDTGIGIPVDKWEEVFDNFSQVDNSPTREFEGAGLGLSVCRQLAEIMDGTINLESVEGKGTTVRFRVKLNKPFKTGA